MRRFELPIRPEARAKFDRGDTPILLVLATARLISSSQAFMQPSVQERSAICRVLVSSLREVELLGPRGERVNVRR